MDKRGVITIISGVLLVFLISGVFAISNPSAVYCQSLGYTYELNSTGNGDGICVISNSVKLDAWSFFEGKTGQQYSYCAKNGYEIQAVSDGKNSFSEDYALCINNSASKKGTAINKSATDLMNFSEKMHSDKLASDEMKKFSSTSAVIQRVVGNMIHALLTGNVVGSFTAKVPVAFDWRNANGNWLTPVKNQGSCGSCWAFATVGDVESKIKIAKNDTSFDIDLSEQDLVSCGVPYGFYNGAGGCEGATLEDPLDYINSTGITDEACFPYTASDSSCSNKCSSSDKRLWKIDNYGYVPLTRNDMKNYLLTKGPIIVGIYMAGSFVDGIYTCSNPGSNLNHAVVIVGYNDTGKYWIVKNSWGSNWNGNGYFNVGYGKCNIETYPMFIDLQVNSSEKVNSDENKINSGIQDGSYKDAYYKDNLSIIYGEKCGDSGCEGFDISNIFSVKSLQKITSLSIIAYQNSSNEKDTSLDYLNEKSSSWESLGTIPLNSYLIKYNLCDSTESCLNYVFDGNLLLRYSHPSSKESAADSSSIDLLYLEAKATSCEDNWTLNSTWGACSANDMQYKNYYDLNNCYKNSSYLNMTVSQSCDYCTPSISQINNSCEIVDTFVSWYNDSNNCFAQTGLQNDSLPPNNTIACDYCVPNWLAVQICNLDDSVTIWYNDSKACFDATGLSSDLAGMPSNYTVPNSCNYTHPIFCGDGICNNGESCSSCSADCGACPIPPSAPSGGGGGGGGSTASVVSENSETAPETTIKETNNADNTIKSSTQTEDTSNENKQPGFSLTGLMVSMQNSSSLKIVLIFIIAAGGVAAFFLAKKYKLSRKYIHQGMMKIWGKR